MWMYLLSKTCYHNSEFLDRRVWAKAGDPHQTAREQSDQGHHCLLFHLHHMSLAVLGFPTRSDTNQAVQVQKLVRVFKISGLESRGIVLLCIENKDADQLRGYREADLRLCFSHMQKAGFYHNEAHLEVSQHGSTS